MNDIYSFSSEEYTTDTDMIETMGIRGKRIMALAKLGVPTLPGFILNSEFLASEKDSPKESSSSFKAAVNKIGKILDKKYGDPENPLLLKMVVSPMLNMVYTVFSLHNIGLCESTINGFSTFVGENFAYHEYRNVISRIIELDLKSTEEEDRVKILESLLVKIKKVKTVVKIKEIIKDVKEYYPLDIFTDPWKQSAFVENLYKNFFKGNEALNDSALLVQAMTFGNYGKESYFGSYYTRNIITGEGQLSGEFFENSFDSKGKKGKKITLLKSPYLDGLKSIASELERSYKEIRRITFTIEDGRLWVIDQFESSDKSTQAEMKTLLDLHSDGIIEDNYLIHALKPGRFAEILHPVLDKDAAKDVPFVQGGIAGAMGAAVGKIYFSTDRLLKEYKLAQQKNKSLDFILIMSSTYAEDVKAIEVARGVVTQEGGYASHAPVVARSLGKIAMVYPEMEFKKDHIIIDGKKLKEGDEISLDVPSYDKPKIYFSKLPLIEPVIKDCGILEFLEIIQKHIGDFDIHANADQPKDAELAKLFKADGIGLCRTEHMFFEEKRIAIFRTLIIADSLEERLKALNKLRPMQVGDFYNLFKIMEGRPVTIRLLDAPLHEFLPHTRQSMLDFIAFAIKQNPKLTDEEVRERCDILGEQNPMLGHRGVRVAITYPEIYNMQVSAIFEAAYKLQKEGIDIVPEIMIPIIMDANEVRAIRFGKKIEGTEIIGIKDIEKQVRDNMGGRELEYKVGVMIELPAAVLNADKIAKYADFFSFGTNDLTQTTNGLSRDDFNSFFTNYSEFDLLEKNPFQVLGKQVKEMIGIAAERGRLTRPDITMGICGEHGAEPSNLPFIRSCGLNYASCSPYGIPIAKLALAQMNTEPAKGQRRAF
ncbi:MAG: PEP-utilizing enzyme [Spirochaetaceae bacterium]|nr:PEP-utilizing enzyme [Spirochaetaceae bacterium]